MILETSMLIFGSMLVNFFFSGFCLVRLDFLIYLHKGSQYFFFHLCWSCSLKHFWFEALWATDTVFPQTLWMWIYVKEFPGKFFSFLLFIQICLYRKYMHLLLFVCLFLVHLLRWLPERSRVSVTSAVWPFKTKSFKGEALVHHSFTGVCRVDAVFGAFLSF